MRKFFKAFTSFSRAERMGTIALCCLLLILLAVRMTMHLWAHRTIDQEREKKLVAEWEAFKQANMKKDTVEHNTDTATYQVREEQSPIETSEDAVPMRKIIRYSNDTSNR